MIAKPQHFHHPWLRSPVPPGLPVVGHTTAGKGPERGWLLLPETRGSGRRSRPLSTIEALTTSGARGGRGALPVQPATRKKMTIEGQSGVRRKRKELTSLYEESAKAQG